MMKISKFFVLVAVAAVGFAMSAPVAIASLGVDFASPPDPSNSIFNPNDSYNLGYAFQANTNVTITGLGTFNNGLPANLPSNQLVGLWDNGGNVLASALTGSGSTQIGLWAFTSIAPITLIAGNNYVVGSQGDTLVEAQGTPIIVDPNITFLSGAWVFQGQIGNVTLVEPTNFDQTDLFRAAYFGGNIQIASVPEPATMLLLGFGLIGLAGVKKFKK